jgi:plasmid stabilization system protein ParE
LARVELARAAIEDIDRLVAVLSLPADTRARIRASLVPLSTFPRLGPELDGRWEGLRFIVGPWRWMLLIYRFDASEDRVVVVTVQDARSSSAAAASRRSV